jgi:predicted O-methyltransferase YrrM
MSEPANYQLLRDITRKQTELCGGNISYLEIGTNSGGSALAVIGTGVVANATLIDNWCYGGSAQSVAKLLGELSYKAHIATGDSRSELPKLSSPFDMIFVDGDHTAEGAWFDMQESLRLLKPDGVMVVDDLDHQEYPFLREVVTRFANENNLTLEIHSVHTGVGVLRRK